MYKAITFIKIIFISLFYIVKTVELVIRNHVVINTMGPFTNVGIWNRETFVTRFKNVVIIMSNRSST